MEKTKKDTTSKRTPPLQRSVEIPDEMWEWLKEVAEERQTSRAGMIRILISAAMKREKKAKDDNSTYKKLQPNQDLSVL
jgi:hypothetical protein